MSVGSVWPENGQKLRRNFRQNFRRNFRQDWGSGGDGHGCQLSWGPKLARWPVANKGPALIAARSHCLLACRPAPTCGQPAAEPAQLGQHAQLLMFEEASLDKCFRANIKKCRKLNGCLVAGYNGSVSTCCGHCNQEHA